MCAGFPDACTNEGGSGLVWVAASRLAEGAEAKPVRERTRMRRGSVDGFGCKRGYGEHNVLYYSGFESSHPTCLGDRPKSNGETFAAAKTWTDETVWLTPASGKAEMAEWLYPIDFREQSYGRR